MPHFQHVPLSARLTLVWFGLALLACPAGSFAQMAPDQPAAVDTQDDDDLDTNLVPLDAELTVDPPDTAPPSTAGEITVPRTEPGGVSEQAPEKLVHVPDSVHAPLSHTATSITLVMDPSVENHIRFFNTSIHDRFEQWLTRLNRYRPMVESIFAEFNLPGELVFLSLVESGFNPYAYSRAKATGPWQFMKGTGKLYGLRIDHYVDERRDPIKSTVAAARYLRDLYDLFGTWPLAMAAYNAGEGKVMRALHKAQAETFWDISKTKLIRRETKQYVPRFMAATVIAQNPDHYGFSQEPVAPHEFEEVAVTRPLHFKSISAASGIPYEDLRLLNPELRRDATPPDDMPYFLKVPVGSSDKIVQVLDKVPTYKFPPQSNKPEPVKAENGHWYRVRVGDTLEKVSKRFRIPLKTLKTRNNLSSPVIKPGDFLLIAH